MRSVGKLIDSIIDLIVTRLVIGSSSRDTEAFFQEYIVLSFVTVILHPEVGGQRVNTNTFIRFVTAVFVIFGKILFLLRIPFGHAAGSQTRLYRHLCD